MVMSWSQALIRLCKRTWNLLTCKLCDNTACRLLSKKYFPLFRLPTPVFVRVLRCLNVHDLRNFSLTCYRLYDLVEATRYMAPRIRVLSMKSVGQCKLAFRFLPEMMPSFSMPSTPSSERNNYCNIFQDTTLPHEPPDYYELDLASFSTSLRGLREYVVPADRLWPQVWLCPHYGAALEEMYAMSLHRPRGSVQTVRDTVRAICPFPKCALWARHALVTTRTDRITYELCSTIKICRYWLSGTEDAHTVLQTDSYCDAIRAAVEELRMNICSHRKLSDPAFVDSLFSADIVCLPAGDTLAEASTILRLQRALDRYCCDKCAKVGTYTTWGFVARSSPTHDGSWIDVELTLCRPLFDSKSRDLFCDPHWIHHSTQQDEMAKHVDYWWKWASCVAKTGFDWRTPLGVGYLRRRRNSSDFPWHLSSQQPLYGEQDKKSESKDMSDRSENFLAEVICGREWLSTKGAFREIHNGEAETIEIARGNPFD